jgi:hypothetical protein
MSKRKLLQVMAIIALSLTSLTPLPTQASPSKQGKGPGEVEIQSTPTEFIENEYLKVLTSDGGRFIIGTTGGEPDVSSDDNKSLLFGYPGNVGSSFGTLRIINGSTTSDYRLGSTDWPSAGIAPTAPPSSDGTTITTTWEQDGVQVEERLYFAHNTATGRSDRAAIEYTIRNNNSTGRDVGLRTMLDVMIVDNDGAPFLIPGVGQVTRQSEWHGANVPDYWVAYASPTFATASLKGHGQLAGGNATRPDRLVIADWTQARSTDWDYTVDPNDLVTNDSAVLLYYDPVTLGSGQTKTYRTYYGIAKTDLQLTYKAYLPLALRGCTLLPDLVVTSIAVNPASPNVGQSATISITAENHGSAATHSWFFVDLYVDPASPPDDLTDLGTHYDYCSQILEPGQSCLVTFTHSFTSGGSHTLYAQADTYDGFNGSVDYGMIEESNEANNIYGPFNLSVEPCTEEIVNGSFENDEAWDLPITKYTASYTTDAAHRGDRAMRIGIVEPADNRYSYSSARQWVTIPSDTISATLRLWLYPMSGDPAALVAPTGPLAPTVEEAILPGDAQYVLILNQDEQWIDAPLLWQRRDDRAWTFHEFDLMAYAGRTIKLHFGAYNDGWGGATGMYLDDVSLELCFSTSPAMMPATLPHRRQGPE